MTDKLLVLASMVISQGKGLIKYYDDQGAIMTVKSKEAQIVDELPVDDLVAETESFKNPDFSDQDSVIEATDDVREFVELTEYHEPDSGPPEATEPHQDSQQEEDSLPAAPVVNPRGKAKTSRNKIVRTPTTAPAKTAPKKTAPAKVATKPAAAAPKKSAPAKTNGHTAANTIRTIAGREHDVSGYVKTRNASGSVSLDNGDSTAEKLREKPLEQVYEIVAKALKEDVAALKKKYKHLNAGMQRMTLGNRMRKVVRAREANV